MQSIDLNCDLGEAFGNYIMPNDIKLMDYISSVNIACGFHAGDPAVMQQTVDQALNKGLAIGAHPGLPDLQGFGRREMKLSASEAYQITLYQVGALHGFLKARNTSMHHVKAHGALYNMAAKDAVLAKAFVEAIYDFDPTLMIYALAGSEMIRAAQGKGMVTVAEVFADRTYQPNGQLTPRTQSDALILDEAQSLAQVLMIVREQRVVASDQQIVSLKGETICLHGDGDHALEFARLINQKLQEEHIIIKAP